MYRKCWKCCTPLRRGSGQLLLVNIDVYFYLWLHSPGEGIDGINHVSNGGNPGTTVLCELAWNFHPVPTRGPTSAVRFRSPSAKIILQTKYPGIKVRRRCRRRPTVSSQSLRLTCRMRRVQLLSQTVRILLSAELTWARWFRLLPYQIWLFSGAIGVLNELYRQLLITLQLIDQWNYGAWTELIHSSPWIDSVNRWVVRCWWQRLLGPTSGSFESAPFSPVLEPVYSALLVSHFPLPLHGCLLGNFQEMIAQTNSINK